MLIPKGYKYAKRPFLTPAFRRNFYLEHGVLPKLALLLDKIGVEESSYGSDFRKVFVADKSFRDFGFFDSFDAFADWAETNALVTLNDSLRVQDTWVPVELCFRLQGRFVAGTDAADLEWVPRIRVDRSEFQMVTRLRYVPDALPVSMSVAEGLDRFFTHPVTASQVEQAAVPQLGRWTQHCECHHPRPGQRRRRRRLLH